MANWSLPTTSSLYTVVLTELKDRDLNAATMFSEALSGATNIATESVKWSDSNDRFERWNGAAWVELSTTYDIDVSSIGGVSLSALLRTAPAGDQTITANKLIFDTDSSTPIDFKGGTADAIVIQFFANASAQSTRTGRIGFAPGGSETFAMQNEYTNGDIDFITDGSGIVQANGTLLIDADNAAGLNIVDSGAIYTATEVEGALQEVKTATNINTSKVTNATHSGHASGSGALTLLVAAITGQTALTSGLVNADEFLISDNGVIKRMDASVLRDYLRGNAQTWAANQTFTSDIIANGELILNAGYSEDADQYTATTGTRTLNTAIATYWYPSANFGTSTITFIFSNPASSGRVTSFSMELLGADDATLTWPTSVEWSEGAEPEWTSGVDIVSFITRDSGTTWYGFLGGIDFS